MGRLTQTKISWILKFIWANLQKFHKIKNCLFEFFDFDLLLSFLSLLAATTLVHVGIAFFLESQFSCFVLLSSFLFFCKTLHSSNSSIHQCFIFSFSFFRIYYSFNLTCGRQLDSRARDCLSFLIPFSISHFASLHIVMRIFIYKYVCTCFFTYLIIYFPFCLFACLLTFKKIYSILHSQIFNVYTRTCVIHEQTMIYYRFFVPWSVHSIL